MVTNCTCNKSRNPPTGKITGRLSNGIMRINIPVDSKSVEEYHTRFDFPEVGVEGILYVAKDENAVYRYEPTNNSYQVVARGDGVTITGDNKTCKITIVANSTPIKAGTTEANAQQVASVWIKLKD